MNRSVTAAGRNREHPRTLFSTKPALDKDRLSCIEMIYCARITQRAHKIRLAFNKGNLVVTYLARLQLFSKM